MSKLSRLVLLLLVLLSGCDSYDPDQTSAYLADLGITGYQLEPSFSSSTFNYVATIPPGTDSITVEVTSAHQGATVTVNGGLVDSDSGSITLQLAAVTNTIKVVVLSPDKMRTQTYTVIVSKQLLSYAVGGTVSGLTGDLTLQNNAGDDLAIAGDGAFEFATPVTDGDDYAVTVSSQPAGQMCSVTNGAGAIAGADVSDVAVDCVDLVAGLFIDDLVVGLVYWCSSGTWSETTAEGSFACPQSDDISFWLGSNQLGPISVAYTIITPLSLFPDDGLAAINLARLLQTLDSDQLPDNGVILIDDALVAALPADLDFSLQPEEFEAAVGMTLVPLETAVQRLRDAIAQYFPENTSPIADAGADRDVTVGATVTLSGAGSSDANGDGLTFTWNFVSTPAGSSAELASRFTVSPSFVADVAGQYAVGVLVSDGTVINYDIVVITANDGSALPAAPQGLQAVAGDALVALSWSPVDGATGYMIYWNTGGNVTSASNWIGPITSTANNFSGLTNGTTYFYRVAAVNASGEGPLSAEVSATPEAPGAGLPAMPQGLQAVAGDALVALNWTAVSGATSYTVYWNTTGGVDNTDAGLAAGSNTGFTHGGLTNDTTYYYRVAASNASGEGPLSAERSATPVGPPVVTYSVGGSVTGFTAGTLTLQNNGADDLVLTPAGAYFTFPTMLADGSTYNVTVSVQPDGLTCTVTYLGSGTISGANVTNVGVTCVDNPPATYSVGGTVSGLSGTVTLQNNGADALEVAANGSFTFATVVNDGSSYAVTVSTQPAAQTCAVINGSGTISGANVNNVELTCVDNTPSSDASLTSLSLSTGPFNQVFQSTLYSYTATVAYSTSSTMVTAVAAQGGTLSINGIEATSGVASDPIALTEGANTISVSVTSQDGTSNQTYTLTVTRAGIAVSGWTHPLDEFSYINPDGAGGAMVTAMNNNGQAIAAWRAYDGSTDCGASGGAACFQVFISQYQNGSWTTPPDLSSNISPDGFHAYPPQVAISDNGDAVVVWQMNTSWTSPCGNVTFQCSHIYMSEYRNGSWTHPTDINDYIDPANTNNVSQTPTVAMDSSGNTIIVWRNFAGGVYKSEYRNGSWVHPQNISDDIPLSYWNPTVAMDDNGNALIVWQGVDSIYNNRIYLSEYRNGAWSHPSNLNTDAINPPGQACPGITCSIPVKIAMDNNDNAIVVWDQRTTSYSDYSDGSIYKSEYRNGAWTHPADVDDKVSLGSDLDWARYPEVAMDDNGNALIIWSQNDETMDCDVPFGINRMVPGPCKQLFMSEYRDGSWTYPLSMSDHISPTGQPVASVSGYQSYSLAMGNTGEAVIAWSQSIPSDICGGTPDRQVFVSEYRDGGWSHPVDPNDYLIDLNIFSYLPLATMDNSGNVLLGWNSLASNLFFSEYHCPGCVTTLPEVIAPRNLQATAADAMVNLSWQEVSNANYYNIYWSTTGVASTSDNLITGISGGTYQHTDLTNKTNYSYFVTAVVSTTESLPSGHASARPSACIGCEPALTSTLLSGSISIDEGNGIAVDSAGNVFVTGYTFGDMDGNISNGSSDIFISKYSGGTRQWTVQPGTADYETGDGIALDADGNIYIVGTGFLLSKYNSVGVLQWSVPVDYNSAMGFGIDLDPTGNVYITGVTTIGLDGNTSQGGADIFISKYDATGTRQWTAQTGTTGNDQGNAIAVDSAGNAYVTGYTLVTGTYTGSSFITKYSTDGDLLWFDEFAWPVGTQYMDRANDIALDADDNAYITGYTNYWLFQNYSLNGFEVYVAKYNTDGCLQWTSQRGVSGSFDYSYGIAVDGDANVFVTGETQGALDGNSFAGERDIFIMKFDSKGIHSWTKQYGEAGIDSGKAIAVDASGNIYTTGSSDGSLNGEVSIGDGSIYNYDVFMMTHSSQE